MFAVETLTPQYCEERSAAEAARRVVALQKQPCSTTPVSNTAAEAACAAVTTTSGSAVHHPVLGQPFMHRPTLSRGPSSSGLLGNIFQGLVARGAMPNSTPSTRAGTPAATESAVVEPRGFGGLSPEAQRDIDICAMRAW